MDHLTAPWTVFTCWCSPDNVHLMIFTCWWFIWYSLGVRLLVCSSDLHSIQFGYPSVDLAISSAKVKYWSNSLVYPGLFGTMWAECGTLFRTKTSNFFNLFERRRSAIELAIGHRCIAHHRNRKASVAGYLAPRFWWVSVSKANKLFEITFYWLLNGEKCSGHSGPTFSD